ncbi:hypothetical protein GGH19_003984 [Coemansia sp. RSA 1807]|nr:hypothetical protein LPJ69_001424 [Coemansia sp. RSA 1752]KAJ2240224.1 hypothetical protein GGH97_004742 [Coemansia sp. RSA 475]KAJ2546672.1 hypothetical protein IWW35_004931 [Coemansia sp. RSA 1878]KAJ2574230.1 hypothetical protein GGH19_003984 [Coemansia sp. RSA 1807]
MKSLLVRIAKLHSVRVLHATQHRSIHASATSSAVLGRIRQVLDQARLEHKARPEKTQDAAPSDPPATDQPAKNHKEPSDATNKKPKSTQELLYESRVQQRAKQKEHLRMPQEYWPADAMLRMPKVFGKFPQPDDAEVAKIVLIGAANAGKSTLVNRLTGAEVSIVSRQPQTTRTRIMASSTVGNKQLVFLDTPGIVSRAGLRRIARGTVTAPWLTLAEASFAVLMLDAYKITEKATFVEDGLFDHFSRAKTIPAFLVVNKVDLITDQEKLRSRVKHYYDQYPKIVGEPIYISAMNNVGIDDLKTKLLGLTKKGDWEVPAHVTSDMSDLTRVEEIIRAEWFELMDSYMPYVITQRNVCWEESNVLYTKNALFKKNGPDEPVHTRETEESIDAVTQYTEGKQVRIIPKSDSSTLELHERPLMRQVLIIKQEMIVPSGGQAKIVIGSGGEHIKTIMRNAAIKISKALRRHVRLNIQVVVEKDRRTHK